MCYFRSLLLTDYWPMWLQDAVWAVRPKVMFYFDRTFVLCMLTLNMKNETEYLKNDQDLSDLSESVSHKTNKKARKII